MAEPSTYDLIWGTEPIGRGMTTAESEALGTANPPEEQNGQEQQPPTN